MQKSYKLYYFELYARAEPIRMMFNKAGIPFEDVRVTGQAWADLKPTLEFGQVPCLEVDGVKMYQSVALYNYVSGVCGFAPTDAMQVYKGEMIYEAVATDLFYKKIVAPLFKPPGEERDAHLVEVKEKHWPAAMATFDKHLPADGKFINGDNLTTHDFSVGSIFLNLLENPNTKDPEFWADLKATKTPPRVLKYIDDLKEAFADHLASRPQNCSL
jgi:glutathione S-transferase